MTEQDIIVSAASDHFPSEPLTAPEELFWYRLNQVYRDYNSGKITADLGAERKQAAISRFRKDRGELNSYNKLCAFHANMWCDIEEAARRYNLSPSIENADRFVEAVYRVGRKRPGKETAT